MVWVVFNEVEITITMFKEMFVLDARSDSDALWQLAEEASFNHFLDFLANVFGKLKSLAFFTFLNPEGIFFIHCLCCVGSCWNGATLKPQPNWLFLLS